jgi:hypothetical protein
MPKLEYIAQRNMVDTEVRDIKEQIVGLQTELEGIHDPAELEVLEVFSTEIRKRLEENSDPSPEAKRKLLQLLHVTVLLGTDGSIEVDGWFKKPEESEG